MFSPKSTVCLSILSVLLLTSQFVATSRASVIPGGRDVNFQDVPTMFRRQEETMCGINSRDGSQKCGMNVCCSASGWCGTTEAHCVNGDPQGGTMPCQEGFGSCEMKKPRTCGSDSGTSNGRTVGYYQGSNTRNRLCNRISPNAIETDGYTHLFYAFASIDPNTFAVVPEHVDDPAQYEEFTALKSRGLETWIAVGGGDFSAPDTPTHRTWSEMASNPDGRAAFIESLAQFMEEHGFQGADLDWEFPVEPTRGGSEGDTENLTLLVNEMRAAYGSRYGISVALPADYGSIRYFDAMGMQASVDFFGFMAYDMHGSWETGSGIRGQADIRDIETAIEPFWFSEIDGSKINLGIALYGRGYTLQDQSCTDLGCPHTGPNRGGECTASPGVLSNVEIEDIIQERNLQPRYLQESMMKIINWEDQWVAYDDDQTTGAKKEWANNLCIGGTMTWSVDFDSRA